MRVKSSQMKINKKSKDIISFKRNLKNPILNQLQNDSNYLNSCNLSKF